jgi:hypothetical protein
MSQANVPLPGAAGRALVKNSYGEPAHHSHEQLAGQKRQINSTYTYLRELHHDAYLGPRQMGQTAATDQRADVLLGELGTRLAAR